MHAKEMISVYGRIRIYDCSWAVCVEFYFTKEKRSYPIVVGTQWLFRPFLIGCASNQNEIHKIDPSAKF